jgi:hypothetical protein
MTKDRIAKTETKMYSRNSQVQGRGLTQNIRIEDQNMNN